MKQTALTGLLWFSIAAAAQTVRFDYDRAADFSAYRTYQWVDPQTGRAPNQLMDQNIKRAVDEQLVLKGLRRVDRAGDLQIAYQVALEREKQFNGFTSGPRWNGMARVTTSNIDIGTIVVNLADPARNQLIWRGEAQKTLDVKKDPDKNYKDLEKAMGKLFKNYPPARAR